MNKDDDSRDPRGPDKAMRKADCSDDPDDESTAVGNSAMVDARSSKRGSGQLLRTLQRWHQLYKTGGIKALEQQPRSDAGLVAPHLISSRSSRGWR